MSQLKRDFKYVASRFRRWHAYAFAALLIMALLSIFGGTIGVPKALVILFGTVTPISFFLILVTLT
jgi:hypothetical protein